MKKSISLFLAFVMIISGIFAANTAYADDYQAPDKIYETDVTQISQTSVKLYWYVSSWYDVKSERFEIAQYDTSAKKYKTIADIKASKESGEFTYTVYNLKAATKYAFALRGYITRGGKKYYSDYSDKILACTSPKDPTLKSAKYSSQGKMKLSWSKVSNATGYVIEYSPSKSFKNDGTTCYLTVSSNTTSKTISGLPKKTYYVRIRSYIKYNKKFYCSDYSKTKSVSIKSGASLKTMINSIKTTTAGREYIKEFTENGVDINKYKTTYDRFKAIYDWHSKHNTDYGWSCVGCNTNFNVCIAALFKDCSKKYETFIMLAADNFKNNDGSVVMHKWSVIYLSGVPYIFDPRLQGYTNNKTGTTYFGVTKNSSVGKKYLFDYWYAYFPVTFTDDGNYSHYSPYYSFPFVSAVPKPATVTAKATAKQGAVKLTWNKVSSAKGYQIQYSTKSDFSSAKSIYIENNSTTAKTLSDLGSNKTYYIRIRAYKKLNNSKLYGYWSEAIKVKTRHVNEADPTSIKKLTAKSKGFNVKWKTVDNASGYQVCYSKTSNFKKSTTKTYKGKNTSSKTISKLSAKTKYYVKIRTYKTINGKKYYSAWSSVKTVKTK